MGNPNHETLCWWFLAIRFLMFELLFVGLVVGFPLIPLKVKLLVGPARMDNSNEFGSLSSRMFEP